MEPEPDAVASGTPTAIAESDVPPAPGDRDGEPRYFHRGGGASVENLRLKPKEAKFNPPGISVRMAPTASAAAQELRTGYPNATKLHGQAKVVGSASIDAIQKAGFDVIPKPSARLPNHRRLVHPDGAAGFSDENLARLAEAFVNTTGN
jgi:hypothetical protein